MNRTQALCNVFGWQGGTIHQIAQETGCDVGELLYINPPLHDIDYCRGYGFGNSNYSPVYLEYTLKTNKSNLFYWIGVAEGRIKLGATQ